MTEEARALNEIFIDAGFEGVPPGGPEDSYIFVPQDGVQERIAIIFVSTLPHGTGASCCMPTGGS